MAPYTDKQELAWYAARTRHGQEVGLRDSLTGLGVESFVPVGRSRSARTGRMVEKPLIPGLVFLRSTKDGACALANERGLPLRYIIDCTTRTLLVVPDKQMQDFRTVLDLSTEEGGLLDEPLALGEKVRVTKGPLRGVEGFVLELQGRTYVVVGLLDAIYAKARVPRAWLERI